MTGMTMTVAIPPPSGGAQSRLSALVERSRLAQFLFLFGFALLIRSPTFGDWNFEVDDQFYALVGQRLVDGARLYTDIWDRKPPALFLTYSLIALVSRAPIAWQIAALLAATAGAYGVCRISRLLTGPFGALAAGLAYLVLLNRLGGATGQAPVFYNPLMIVAAGSIINTLEALRDGRINSRLVTGIMAAGLALLFKQTAIFECIFFGFYICVALLRGRSGLARASGQIALLVIAACLPTLIVFAWYWQDGHLQTLWHALVASNFSRGYTGFADRTVRFITGLGMLGMPIVFGALAIPQLMRDRVLRAPTLFVILWSGSAFAGLAIFPNIRIHYLLPLVTPLCILSASFFERHRTGRLGLIVLIGTNLAFGGAWNLADRWRNHIALPRFERYVAEVTPHRKLLVFGTPSLLYARIGAIPPSRLAFPPHFFEGGEAGASGMDEVAELRRVLDAGPETVVTVKPLRFTPYNMPNIRQVAHYMRQCRQHRAFTIYDHEGPLQATVSSGCAARPYAGAALSLSRNLTTS
ncbi:hypothetical protein SAMN05518801_106181 [Novosphingobium sp. CF614]|uniref:hypothetical protein n=1 Tax=Novosphingobium sp. CF614 TaxID=1884364 RepID=UPI0008EA0B1C|nr:hypothetical protein [Novosphingobium sp. CF614]SFG05734.1 hypothetical protein SAMN05518801_106181 [Novosphingobium sp. CF614]